MRRRVAAVNAADAASSQNGDPDHASAPAQQDLELMFHSEVLIE
jgi:hypothetical protein